MENVATMEMHCSDLLLWGAELTDRYQLLPLEIYNQCLSKTMLPPGCSQLGVMCRYSQETEFSGGIFGLGTPLACRRFLRTVMQSETLYTQASFLQPLLSQVSDQPCGL